MSLALSCRNPDFDSRYVLWQLWWKTTQYMRNNSQDELHYVTPDSFIPVATDHHFLWCYRWSGVVYLTTWFSFFPVSSSRLNALTPRRPSGGVQLWSERHPHCRTRLSRLTYLQASNTSSGTLTAVIWGRQCHRSNKTPALAPGPSPHASDKGSIQSAIDKKWNPVSIASFPFVPCLHTQIKTQEDGGYLTRRAPTIGLLRHVVKKVSTDELKVFHRGRVQSVETLLQQF